MGIKKGIKKAGPKTEPTGGKKGNKTEPIGGARTLVAKMNGPDDGGPRNEL